MNGSPRFTSVHPVFAVQDLRSEVEYYTSSLGFEVAWMWGEPPVRAGVGRDDLGVQLAADGRFAPDGASIAYFSCTWCRRVLREVSCPRRGDHHATR